MELRTIIFFLVLYVGIRLYQSRRASSEPIMSHGKVVNIDNDVIFKALTSSGPAVIDFYATWCGPCKAVAPKVGELSEKYQNVRFIQVDVDKMRAVAQQYNVTAMPTFVFLKDGKEIVEKRVRGADIRALEAGIQAVSA
ncbi:Thioredoxin [Penicillium lividum]|nr:Thioredoxin [Penicillium lividum]